MNAIEVCKLTKRFGDLVAVDNIDFSVKEGEVYGFLGPNGAGKTTTIRMLSGLARPSGGEGKVKGFDIVKEQQKVKQSIGVVPDVSNLYGELSARENLIFMCRLYGLPRRERQSRCDELLREFDLFDRRDDAFRKFSRGMKRRLTIAAALVHRPTIIFMDEPTSGLDAASARGLRMTVKRLNKAGVTVFLTTHYIEEADQLCHRVAIIAKGRIMTVDTPEALKKWAQEEEILELGLQGLDDESLRRLSDAPGVSRAVFADGLLKVYISSLNRVLPEIVKILEESKTQVGSIRSVLPSLEDAFVRITGLEAQKPNTNREEFKP